MSRLVVEESARRLARWFEATVTLMKVPRACGHAHLNEFALHDLSTWDRDMAYLTGIQYAGVAPL